ncbi:HAD-IIA family hydrolase [candidate division KSB1 bacterium]|nr:HAD-IIA family hydrolase [candidate division KSB1 bacterium]
MPLCKQEHPVKIQELNGKIENLKSCKAIVCDLDGTLYLSGEPVEKSHEFLQKVLESGRQLFYFTNNTSRSRKTYLDKLKKLGFPSDDHFLITAADCAENYLKRNNLFPRIYLVGNRDLYADFERRGFEMVDGKAARHLPFPAAVVLGYDTELTFEKIHICYDLLIQDVPYIATHADKLCPLAGGRFMPDVGSFISMFETATDGKRPVVVGKPHQEAVETIAVKSGCSAGKIAFIGDRLYTDIRMAQKYNMVGVLVLSGETNRKMLLNSPDQPQLVVNSVSDLIDYL